jgi:hypothetical protein
MFLSVTSIGMKPNAEIRPSGTVAPSLCAHDVLLKQISYDAAFVYPHSRYTATNCDEQRMALYRASTVLAVNYIKADCTSRTKSMHSEDVETAL